VPVGSREIDTQHDWNAAWNKYTKYGKVEDFPLFLNDHKNSDLPTPQEYQNTEGVVFDDNQTVVINLLEKQMAFLRDSSDVAYQSVPKRTIVQGKAGNIHNFILFF